jgi:RNA polymerase sigma-70 factor (ECF subfamily)
LKLKESEIEKLTAEGAKRLLGRADDRRSLTVESVALRVRSAVEKYLLRADESADAAAVTGFIDALQADDLCLIIACEGGDQEAWTDLVQRFSSTVRSAARSSSSSEDAAEDLAQSIWAELHGLRARNDGRPGGKLAYYSGRGSLAGWLRAVVAQLAVDEHRKQSRLVQAAEDTELDRMARDATTVAGFVGSAPVVADPEQSVSNKVAGTELQQALECALRNLSDEDRLLVKFYYFDNLRLREAGALLGVHEATASRRLARVHKELRQHVEQTLSDRGWTSQETERAFAEVAINLQSDIEAIVATEVAPAAGNGARLGS